MAFTDKIRSQQKYQDRPIEGFVVRWQLLQPNRKPNQTHFFKVKYDEPYLMYREYVGF